MEKESLKFTIWVTTDCNMKCKYCYEGNDKQKFYMDKHTAESTVEYLTKQLKVLDVKSCIVHFHGGEPLLAFDIIQYIMGKLEKDLPRNIDVHYSITTNASILNGTIKRFLLDKFHTISVSIDGNQKSHDSMRIFHDGRGTHEIALKNSISLAGERKSLRIRMTITPENVADLSENIIFLVNMGFTYISPQIDLFNKTWTEEHISRLEQELINAAHYLKDTDKSFLSINLVNRNRVYSMDACTGGMYSFNIDPAGKIFPCTFTVGKDEFIIGNIFNGLYKEKISEIQEINKQDVQGCFGCSYYKYCVTSMCKLVNKCITGDFLKASPILCAIENLKLRMMSIRA